MQFAVMIGVKLPNKMLYYAMLLHACVVILVIGCQDLTVPALITSSTLICRTCLLHNTVITVDHPSPFYMHFIPHFLPNLLHQSILIPLCQQWLLLLMLFTS
jgi:hypothetical protein